jgi:hypothetical protein
MIHLSLFDYVLIGIHISNCIDINIANIFVCVSSCYGIAVVILVLRVKTVKHFYSNFYANVKINCQLIINLITLE